MPPYRRRACAGATYSKTRRSELEAIGQEDTDLAHLTFSITKQVDRKAKSGKAKVRGTKKTKTRRSRTIDIEPNLMPLVERLRPTSFWKDGRLSSVSIEAAELAGRFSPRRRRQPPPERGLWTAHQELFSGDPDSQSIPPAAARPHALPTAL